MKRYLPMLIGILLVLAVVAVYLSYRTLNQEPIPTSQPALTNEGQPVECYTDADCMVAGCSGTLCVPRDEQRGIVTTCEYKEEYACFANDNCLCVHNKCNWQGSELFRRCVDQLQGVDCSTLTGAALEQCEAEQGETGTCAGLTGFDYIECQQGRAVTP